MENKAELLALAERSARIGIAQANRAIDLNPSGHFYCGSFGTTDRDSALQWFALAAALRARAEGGE